MKPDWKDAPKGAKWLAMNETGAWLWHFKKPKLVESRFGDYWESDNNQVFAKLEHKNSLEKKPTTQKV